MPQYYAEQITGTKKASYARLGISQSRLSETQTPQLPVILF